MKLELSVAQIVINCGFAHNIICKEAEVKILILTSIKKLKIF